MKALLALRSVGFCVGQRQMCLNVRWVSFFFVFMQQKYLCHSVVCFVFFTMNGNVLPLAAVGDFGALHCQPSTNVDRSTALDLTTSAPIAANGC